MKSSDPSKDELEKKLAQALSVPFVVSFGVAHTLACLTTIARLIHRYRRRQLWWDDLFALVASVASLFLVCTTVAAKAAPKGGYSIQVQALLFWCGFFLTTTVVWSSRLSILSTVIYFLPPGRNRLITVYSFAILCVGYLTALVSKIFYSGIPVRLLPQPPFCKEVAILNIVLDTIATVWLVGWPAYILARMKLRKPVRRLFTVCFSCTACLAAMDIFHGVNVMTHSRHLFLSSHLELLFSVLVANIVVVAAYVYRTFNGISIESEESGEPSDHSTGTKVHAHGAATQYPTDRRATSYEATSSSIGPFTTIYTGETGGPDFEPAHTVVGSSSRS
ncbi:hypothetical protein CC1G_09278 [Coprinopsis cinerea okayama7|uniref:Integral membrane protein n=1 Tax=Coprinopsis cinerea (strain Okayama-7 / 130 / ATCC MYA-4618 / FGSC 9003) TaxID=240176 RepID=A8N857_COPC7|nr:hypothetical protein CC1G_09278 [Coprinopsis cinerea okayama7\|eukprot:XP_001831013.1 hypothetical protein CC1G_09278 [Coprinopsis cinerea okayama7\